MQKTVLAMKTVHIQPKVVRKWRRKLCGVPFSLLRFEVGVPRAGGSVVYHSNRGSCLDASARFLARNVIAEGALEAPKLQLDLDGLLCLSSGLCLLVLRGFQAVYCAAPWVAALAQFYAARAR